MTRWSLPRLPSLPDMGPMGTDPEGPALEQAAQSLTDAKQGIASTWEAVESPMRRATDAWSRLTPSIQKQ
jgi:hypothetical protein